MKEYFLNIPPEQEQTDYFCDVNNNRISSEGTNKESHNKKKNPKISDEKKKRTLLDILSGRGNITLNQCYTTSDKTLNNTFRPKDHALSKDQKRDKFLLYKFLPFINKKQDFGIWIYRHKVSVSVTMGVYIISLLIFLSVKIDLLNPDLASALTVELQSVEPPPIEKPEEEKKPVVAEDDEPIPTDVKNQKSDANSKTINDKSKSMSDIEKQAQDMQNMLNESRNEYHKGLKSTDDMIKEFKTNKNNSKEEVPPEKKSTKVRGNVTVEYDLKDRTSTHLPVAAYQCEEAGRVVIDIMVNNNGDVITASVARSSSKSVCLAEMALNAARESKFNISESAPSRQKGTITYLFLAQ